MQWICIAAALGVASWIVYRQVLDVFKGDGCSHCNACGGCLGTVRLKGASDRNHVEEDEERLQ